MLDLNNYVGCSKHDNATKNFDILAIIVT